MQRGRQLADYELTLMEGLNVLSLTYEDNLQHSDQHQQTVDRICNFLGVPSSPVKSAYRKQASDRWQDGVLNHQELTEFLSKTSYAHYLDDL